MKDHLEILEVEEVSINEMILQYEKINEVIIVFQNIFQNIEKDQ